MAVCDDGDSGTTFDGGGRETVLGELATSSSHGHPHLGFGTWEFIMILHGMASLVVYRTGRSGPGCTTASQSEKIERR